MKRDIFEEDYLESQQKLKNHQRKGFFMKLFSFGILNNDRNIQEYEKRCESSRKDLNKRNQLLQEAKELDMLNDTIEIKGIRISRNTFADINGEGSYDYPDNWQEIRKEILERDGYQCQEADGSCRGLFKYTIFMNCQKAEVMHRTILSHCVCIITA